MVHVARGKVRGGTIVFEEPLTLPEGTEVQVRIEPVAEETAAASTSPGEHLRLPFFGMWADREEMSDSIGWVRRTRDEWQQRAARQD